MRLVFLLALFLVMGCGGSKKKDTLELSLQPAKGPFKSATVQAYGLNDNVSAVGLELKNSLPEFKNGVASVVLKDKKKAMTFAHIVFTFENPIFTLSGDYTDFQTATGDRRIDQGQILLPFETANISSSSNILSAVQGGDLIDHLALVQALGQGGLMDSNGRFPGWKTQ